MKNRVRIPASTTRALVLMPMLRGYEAVRETVAEAIVDAGLELVWLEDLLEDWEWLDWLYASVGDCDIVLADPSEHNAFVMYELGIVRPERKPSLLILNNGDSQLSGSLDGSPFRPYSNAELDDFSCQLRADLSLLTSAVSGAADPSLDITGCFPAARRLARSFTEEAGRRFDEVGEDAFNSRLAHSISHGTFVPILAGTPLGDAALLAALIRSSRMVDTMSAIRAWITRRAHV